MTSASVLTQPDNFGIQFQGGLNTLGPPQVGLVPPDDTAFRLLTTESLVVGFSVIRFANSDGGCSVKWRVGGLPVELFEGVVLPTGQATFEPLETSEPAAFVLLAAASPVAELSGVVELFDPVDCEIDPVRSSFGITILPAIVVPGDALVGLVVPFTEITRGGGASTTVRNRAGEVVKNAAGVEVRSA